MTGNLQQVLAAIDDCNAQDPNKIADVAAELLYGQRMSESLATFMPLASEELQIAVRGQHIERWTLLRAHYPEGKAGYLRWRIDQKDRHAAKVGALMAAAGFEDAEIRRVAALIRKEKFKTDAEAQALEDVACLVFLEYYAADFIAKHPAEKVDDIIRKTWKKMSVGGQQAALKLSLNANVLVAVQRALSS